MIKSEILTTIVGRFIFDKKSVFILANSHESGEELSKILNMANIRHGLIGYVPLIAKYRCQIIPYKTFNNIKDKLKKEGWRFDVIIRETQSDNSLLISSS